MRLNLYGNEPIITPRDPQLPMEAANKNYVDNSLKDHKADKTLHITPEQNTLLDALTVTADDLNKVSGLTGNVQTQIDSKVAKAGDSMTGPLVLSGNPTESQQAANKSYVDQQDATKVAKAGDTLTGFLTLHADPASAMHPATKQFTETSISTHSDNMDLHLTPSQNAMLDAVTVGAVEINRLNGVSGNVQTQIDSKVAKAGDTMTGPLALSGNPTVDAHASNKAYVDQQDATKVAKAGDTMTGPLALSGAPSAPEHAVTKAYSDAELNTHAGNASLHMTTAQNEFMDAITVGADKINLLDGATSNVQTQINTKFDKAGGTVTGDITLADGKTLFVNKVPEGATEVVNKAYVDAMARGQKWEDPVSDINLVSTALSAPPATPLKDDVYIVGAAPTGDWAGKAGYAGYHNGTAWVWLQSRAVAVGDRFGIALTTPTAPGVELTANAKKLVTITTATPGAIAFSVDTDAAGSSTLVFDPDSAKFGITYTKTDEGDWVPTNTSVNITDGVGVAFSGSTLNVVYARGLTADGKNLEVKLDAAGGVKFNASGEVGVKTDGVSLTVSPAGVKLADTLVADIADRVSKSGSNDVTGSVTFKVGSTLKSEVTPTATNDVVTKGYVDSKDDAMQADIDALEVTVGTLNTDPVTKNYVDTRDATKVAKAGDTLTGFLTLHANPEIALHPATKGYVDGGLTAHAEDGALHLTTAQNALLDAVNATASELNYSVGVTSGIQNQIDGKVAKAGDTMTGPLALSGDPTLSAHAANKAYVDQQDATKVSKAGDTMTGQLKQALAPVDGADLSNKQYVDASVSNHATNNALHLTEEQNTFLDGVTVTSAEVNRLAGVTANVQTQLDAKLNLTGGTMTGVLSLNADPEQAMSASTKRYTDQQDATKVAKAGDTMTGHLTLHAAPTVELHSATKGYVDTTDAATRTYVDQQDATKVAKAGSTMTGPLILNSDPTAELQSATKQYVDTGDATLKSYVDVEDGKIKTDLATVKATVDALNADPVTKTYVDTQDNTKLNKSGGTLTGYVTLHADPQQAMHPTTKQYVDAIAQGLSTKPSVRFATTGNLAATYDNGAFGVNATLTASANGALVVDGGSPVAGDRILVRLQTNAAHNGDYVVQQTGSAGSPYILKRAMTVDESKEVPGSYFYTYDGSTLKATGWTFTVANPITFTIGTDAITVNQFSGQGSMIAGNGCTLDGNTLNINTANPARIVVNADNIDLAVTGVTPGSYTKVTADGYGRITEGSNPNTLAGYGITDGQPLNANLTSLSGVATIGIIARDATNTIVTKALNVTGGGLSIANRTGGNSGDVVITSNATSENQADTLVQRDASGNFTAGVITAALVGNADTATVLKTARNFKVEGDVTSPEVSFNGSGNVTLTTTLANSGVTAGTFTKVSVNAKGIVTGGSTPTLIADTGVTDVYNKSEIQAFNADMLNALAEIKLYLMSRI